MISWVKRAIRSADIISGIGNFEERRLQHPAIDSATKREVLLLLEQSYKICREKSQASRDSRRVFHAIRLILNGFKRRVMTLHPALISAR